MSDIRVARNRIIALCEFIQLPSPLGASHAYETDEECSFGPDDLPAFVVIDLPDEQYSRMSSDAYGTQAEFLIMLYVSPIADESYRKNVDAWDLVRDCMETVNDFFAAKPTLGMNDGGAIAGAQMSRGRRTTLTAKGSDTKYHGATFRMSVSNVRRVERDDGVE